MQYVPVSVLTQTQQQAQAEGREVTATELLLAASLHKMDAGAVAFQAWCEQQDAEPSQEVDAAGTFKG